MRMCPICKNPAKLISIWGTTGSGVTVSIKEYECVRGHHFKIKTENNSFFRISKRKKNHP